MKHWAGDMEAQMSDYERTMSDRERAQLFKSHDVRKMWGLSFRGGSTLIFFTTRERMTDRLEHYMEIYGEALIIKPKNEILRAKKGKLPHPKP